MEKKELEKEGGMEKRGGTMGSNLRGLTSIVYYLLFVVFVSGCARGVDVISTPKKYIEITLTVEGKIDSSSGTYLIVFDVNDKYPGEGPYFDAVNNLCKWTDGIVLEKNVFSLVHLEEDGGRSSSPFQQGVISDNKIVVRIDLELLGNPSKLDLNLFTTDSEGKPLDALGEGWGDGAAFITLGPPITTAYDRLISDSPDDCEEVNFNITGGGIRVLTY